MRLEVESVIMVARDDPSAGQHIALSVGDGQDIRGFSLLASLISHRLAAFLGDGMAAIQVQPRQVRIRLDRLNTVLPDLFQTPVGAPLLEVVVDRLPTDLFFLRRRRDWGRWATVPTDTRCASDKGCN